MQPLLSIVIPTKNRYKYLKSLLLYLDGFNSDLLEVVIQDNSDDNRQFVDFLKSQKLPQLNYFYTKSAISVIDNCDLAVNNSNGSYVCFLGDDDFISEQIIDVIQIMKLNAIDSLSCHAARYNWPDLQKAEPSLSSLLVYKEKGSPFYLMDPKKRLNELLRSQQYSLNNLPKLYHGVVSRAVLDDIYVKCGSFFPGFSPDISNAVAVCIFSKKHLHIELPLIVAGFGLNSAAGLGAQKRHVMKIDQVTMLPRDVKERWNSAIPYIWTGNSVWAASIIESLTRLGQFELLSKFSFVNFYSKFIRATPHLIKYAAQSSFKNTLAAIIWGIPKLIIKKILSKLPYVNVEFGDSMYTIEIAPISLNDASNKINEFNSVRLNNALLCKYLKGEGEKL